MTELRVEDFVRPSDRDIARGLRALRDAAAQYDEDVRIIFPERAVYLVRERNTLGHWGGYYNWPLFFRDLVGLRIEGNGSRIQQLGGYVVATDRKPWGGLRLMNCEDVIVSDLEFDGGAQTLIRNPATYELDASGVALHGCTDVRLERVVARNTINDGYDLAWHNLETGAPCKLSTQIEMIDCVADGAARNGLSVTGARDVHALRCSFVRTGRHVYGGHAPGAGIDVEADRYPGDTGNDPPPPLQRTGRIRFERCRIEDNITRTVVAHYERHEDVSFINCDIEGHAQAGDFETDFASPGTIVRACRIRTRHLRMSHNTGQPQDAGRWAIYEDNVIEILPGGKNHESSGKRIRTARNSIASYGAGDVCVWENQESEITDNVLFRSIIGYDGAAHPFLCRFEDCDAATEIDGNRFLHDTGADIWIRVQRSPMPTRSMLDPHVLWDPKEVIP